MGKRKCAWCKGEFPEKDMRASALRPGKWRCKNVRDCEQRILASIIREQK